MELLPGFNWPVLRAFGDAVGQCKFVEGDMLYSDEFAYTGDWEKIHKKINHTIQVRFPARDTGAGLDSQDRQVFKRNWDSTVKLDLYEKSERMSSLVETTQGRLYTALWKNDISVLDNSTPKPPVPLIAAQLTKRLSEIEPKLMGELKGKEYKSAFVMPYDVTNPTLRTKLSQLNHLLRCKPLMVSGSESSFKDAENIAPTVEIAIFPVKDKNRKQLREELKKVLYKPSKKVLEEGGDNFKISAHGLLIG